MHATLQLEYIQDFQAGTVNQQVFIRVVYHFRFSFVLKFVHSGIHMTSRYADTGPKWSKVIAKWLQNILGLSTLPVAASRFIDIRQMASPRKIA